MSQTDLNVANASGASVRADLNAHLDAVASNHSGGVAPTPTFPNQWWVDTSTNILKQRDDANTAWVNVASKVGANWVPYRNGTLLGDAAERTIGTSGATVPLLDALNTWGAVQTFVAAIDESEAAPVASAATTDIWVTDGNTVHVTGVVTITSFGTAPRAGAWRKVTFDGVLTLTHGANLILPGIANITTAPGDFAFVYAETTTVFKVLYFKANGTPVVDASKVVQFANTQTGAVATGTSLIPFDDSIPQNNEGTQYMTLVFTPKDTANILVIEVDLIAENTTAVVGTVALFKNAVANALAVGTADLEADNIASGIYLRHKMTAGTISAITFKVRAGGHTGGTFTFNGLDGNRKYGGVLASNITITEYLP